MKKLLSISVLTIILILVLSGCNKTKVAISSNDFKTTAEAAKYTVSSSDAESIKDIGATEMYYISDVDNILKIEFYTFESAEDAGTVFDNIKNNMSANYEKSKGEIVKSSSGSNYGNYSITDKQVYCYISYVDNTIVYAVAPYSSKDKIVSFVESIDY